MSSYQVTLNQGRTDTVTVDADTLHQVKTFFESVSTANITSIKKIVFSKELGIGGSILSNYIPNNQNKYLNIMVKNSKGQTGVLNFSFPIKNLTNDVISASIKSNCLLLGEPITEILNIIVVE